MSPSRRRIARDSRSHAPGRDRRPAARTAACEPVAPAARTCREGCALACGTPGGGIFANPAVRRAGPRGNWCAVAATTGLHRFTQQERHQPAARAESHEELPGMASRRNFLGSEHPGNIGNAGSAGRARARGLAGVAGLLAGGVTGTSVPGQSCRASSEARESKCHDNNPGRRRLLSLPIRAAIRNAFCRSAGARFGMSRCGLTHHRERSSSWGT